MPMPPSIEDNPGQFCNHVIDEEYIAGLQERNKIVNNHFARDQE